MLVPLDVSPASPTYFHLKTVSRHFGRQKLASKSQEDDPSSVEVEYGQSQHLDAQKLDVIT